MLRGAAVTNALYTMDLTNSLNQNWYTSITAFDLTSGNRVSYLHGVNPRPVYTTFTAKTEHVEVDLKTGYAFVINGYHKGGPVFQLFSFTPSASAPSSFTDIDRGDLLRWYGGLAEPKVREAWFEAHTGSALAPKQMGQFSNGVDAGPDEGLTQCKTYENLECQNYEGEMNGCVWDNTCGQGFFQRFQGNGENKVTKDVQNEAYWHWPKLTAGAGSDIRGLKVDFDRKLAAVSLNHGHLAILDFGIQTDSTGMEIKQYFKAGDGDYHVDNGDGSVSLGKDVLGTGNIGFDVDFGKNIAMTVGQKSLGDEKGYSLTVSKWNVTSGAKIHSFVQKIDSRDAQTKSIALKGNFKHDMAYVARGNRVQLFEFFPLGTYAAENFEGAGAQVQQIDIETSVFGDGKTLWWQHTEVPEVVTKTTKKKDDDKPWEKFLKDPLGALGLDFDFP